MGHRRSNLMRTTVGLTTLGMAIVQGQKLVDIGAISVAKCEVALKDAGVTMPTFYIPSEDIPTFKEAVAGAEMELRREAASVLHKAKTDEARKAVRELMEMEFVMRCETSKLNDYGGKVDCQMCNYHESPTMLHLVQGTVLDTNLESCMTGIFDNRTVRGANYHPTCFPDLPAKPGTSQAAPLMVSSTTTSPRRPSSQQINTLNSLTPLTSVTSLTSNDLTQSEIAPTRRKALLRIGGQGREVAPNSPSSSYSPPSLYSPDQSYSARSLYSPDSFYSPPSLYSPDSSYSPRSSQLREEAPLFTAQQPSWQSPTTLNSPNALTSAAAVNSPASALSASAMSAIRPHSPVSLSDSPVSFSGSASGADPVPSLSELYAARGDENLGLRYLPPQNAEVNEVRYLPHSVASIPASPQSLSVSGVGGVGGGVSEVRQASEVNGVNDVKKVDEAHASSWAAVGRSMIESLGLD